MRQILSLHGERCEVNGMKTLAMGLGMVAGAAITLTVINTMYPDIPRRMMRDGRRMARQTRKTFSEFSDMVGR